MALVLANRVQETTTTTGTGTITLAGAVSGFQSFAVIGNGNTTYYTITSGTDWEVGIGTYSTTGPTLARTTIISSSASGAAITLTGTSTVFATYPAEKSVNLDAVGSLAIGGTAISTPAWGVNGIALKQAATTFTDNSTAASGTVALAYMNLFNTQTYAASNTSVTVSGLYGVYFKNPAAGTNVTATTTYAIGADSAAFSTISVAGNSGITSGTGTVSASIAYGATASGSTKTVNIGTNGLSGSTTTITIGGTAGTSNTTLNGTCYSPAPSTAELTAVSSQVALSGRLYANRPILSTREPTGGTYPISAHPANRRYAQAQFGAGTGVTTLCATNGLMAFTAVANTVAADVPTTTLPFYRSRITTAALTSVITSWRSTTGVIAGAPFFYSFRFGAPGTAGTYYAFAGLVDVSTAPAANNDPLFGTNTPGRLGVGLNASANNWTICNNLSGSTINRASLTGADYSGAVSAYYEFLIWSDGTNFYWQIAVFSGGLWTSQINTGTFSGTVPASGTLLYPTIWVSTTAADATGRNITPVLITRETES